MGLFTDSMRETYRTQRIASQGASITLVSRCGEYVASFDCATRCAVILGDRNLIDAGTKSVPVPVFKIPIEDVHRSCMKLAETFSVALIDLVSDEKGSRFILVWKILPRAEEAKPESLPDPNQETLNLDDY